MVKQFVAYILIRYKRLLPRRGLLCRASNFLMMLVRCPVSVCLGCNAHLDADPDLDASTNRAFRDVRDVGPNIFG